MASASMAWHEKHGMAKAASKLEIISSIMKIINIDM